MIKIEDSNYDLKTTFGLDRGKKYEYKMDKWNDKYSILESKEVIRWIQDKMKKFASKGSGKNPADFKILNYAKVFQDYCDYNKVSEPAELLIEPLDDRNRRVQDYLDYLIKGGRNEVSVSNMIQAIIKSFYSTRGSPVTYQKDNYDSGKNYNEIILLKNTIQLIQQHLNSANYRLILKIQTQLGLRIDDILKELTNGKYSIKKYKKHYYIPKFETKKEAVIINFLFFPKELAHNLIVATNTTDLTKLDLSKLLSSRISDNKIDKTNYLKRIKEVTQELKIDGNIKTHSFRKYFSSQVRGTRDIAIEFSEHLMGHKGKNLTQSYNNNLKDIKWFYQEWLKVETNLLIDAEIIDKTNEEIVSLKEKIIQQDEQMKLVMKDNLNIKEENAKDKEEIAKIKEKMAKMVDIVNAIQKENKKNKIGYG